MYSLTICPLKDRNNQFSPQICECYDKLSVVLMDLLVMTYKFMNMNSQFSQHCYRSTFRESIGRNKFVFDSVQTFKFIL